MWQAKFKQQKHVGLAILTKVQLIIAKFFATASHPDNLVATFRDAPLILLADSDAASAAKLIKYFLDNLDCAIITMTLGIFSKVPNIYTKLFSPATVVQQQVGCEAGGKLGKAVCHLGGITPPEKGGAVSATT